MLHFCVEMSWSPDIGFEYNKVADIKRYYMIGLKFVPYGVKAIPYFTDNQQLATEKWSSASVKTKCNFKTN